MQYMSMRCTSVLKWDVEMLPEPRPLMLHDTVRTSILDTLGVRFAVHK